MTRVYTILGWVIWQVARRGLKRELEENRAKLGAAGVVALVLLGGVLAAKHGSDD